MAASVEIAEVPSADLARQRRSVLGIVNVSHTINHMNGSMVPVMFAVMMTPLGFGFAEIGVLSTVHQVISSAMQAMYGFLTRFASRAVILGTGNIVMGLATILTAGAQNFTQLAVLRGVAGAGSSPQHPVGSTMLSSYFGNARGKALGLHNTAGSVGTLLAPIVAGAMLFVFDWRVVLILLGIPSILVGLSYFWLRDVVRPADEGRHRPRAGWDAYLACLKNKDLMLVCALMMVGAAGRGGGINQTYLVPHFVTDLGIAVAVAATLLTLVNFGGLIAPMAWGWLSDAFPRKLVMQVSLGLSAIATVWLGEEGALGASLIAGLAVYGVAVNARQAITQAMVGDYAGPGLEDAAFSLYFTIGFISGPIWTLAMGALMQETGFAFATKVIAISYVAGMLLLIPLRLKPRSAVAAG